MTTNSNISKSDLSTSRSRAATKDLKQSFTYAATAKTIYWPSAKVINAKAATRAGFREAGVCNCFRRRKKSWRHCRAIPLPNSLPFVDYSGMSVDNGRVAIVSQMNSMLWVGQLNEADWTCHDAGQLYEFPRSDNGSIRYGNIEGVGWIAPSRIVTVSDRRKKK